MTVQIVRHVNSYVFCLPVPKLDFVLELLLFFFIFRAEKLSRDYPIKDVIGLFP